MRRGGHARGCVADRNDDRLAARTFEHRDGWRRVELDPAFKDAAVPRRVLRHQADGVGAIRDPPRGQSPTGHGAAARDGERVVAGKAGAREDLPVGFEARELDAAVVRRLVEHLVRRATPAAREQRATHLQGGRAGIVERHHRALEVERAERGGSVARVAEQVRRPGIPATEDAHGEVLAAPGVDDARGAGEAGGARVAGIRPDAGARVAGVGDEGVAVELGVDLPDGRTRSQACWDRPCSPSRCRSARGPPG